MGGTIDITGILNMAFSMPRDGVITSISGYWSSTTNLVLGGSSIEISAQLFSSSAPNDVFTPIVGAIVNLMPVLTGSITIGDTFHNVASGLTIPVTAVTRILMVFSAAVTGGPDIAIPVFGYASAGICIE